MRTLILGCCGYIGSKLTESLLKHGFIVYGIDNCLYNNQSALLPFLNHPKFRFYKLNILKATHLIDLYDIVDVIFPFAALVGQTICDKHPEQAMAVNYKSIVDLVKYTSPQQKIIFPMSTSCLGDNGGVCDENSPAAPVSVYSRSKQLAKQVLLDRQNTAILQLGTVCGLSYRPRMELLINDFTTRIWFNKSIELYQPNYQRGAVYIGDVVNTMVFALENNLQGVYNVSNAEMNLTKLEFAERIFRELGIRENITIKDEKDHDARNYKISVDKLKAAGFQCTTPLEEIVAEVYHYIKLFNKYEEVGKLGNV